MIVTNIREVTPALQAVVMKYVNQRKLPKLPDGWVVAEPQYAAQLVHAAVPKWSSVALVIHHWNWDGKLTDYKQAIFFSADGAKRSKLVAPADDIAVQRLYIPRSFPRDNLPEGARVLRLESAAKAERATLLGYLAVAANGMDGYWHGGGKPIPDYIRLMEMQARTGGQSIILFDAPKAANAKSVGRTEDSIRRMFEYEEATASTPVLVARIPANLDGQTSDGITELDDAVVHELVAKSTLYTVDPQDYVQRLPKNWDTTALEPIPAILPGVLIFRSMVLIAPQGGRKTTVAVLLASQLILGEQVFDRAPGVHDPAVLYVTGEDEMQDILTTLKNFPARGPAQSALLAKRLIVLDVNTVPAVPQLSDTTYGKTTPGALFPLVEKLLSKNPAVRFVIFDTYSALGGNEIDNQSAAIFHRAVNRLCSLYNVGILTLHHPSQDAELNRAIHGHTARGVTGIDNNARAVHQLMRDRGTAEDLRYPAPPNITNELRRTGNVYRWHTHKVRWGDTSPDRPFWIVMQGWNITTHDALPPGNEPLPQSAFNDHADRADLLTLLRYIEVHSLTTFKELLNANLPAAPTTRTRATVMGRDRLRSLLDQAVHGKPKLVNENELVGRGNPIGHTLTKAGDRVINPKFGRAGE